MIAQKNPTCDIRYYKGGLGCCHHLYYLLDKNQSHLIPDDILEYHMKMRFYFQEFQPERHQQLYRWHWQCVIFLILIVVYIMIIDSGCLRHRIAV